MPPLRHGSHAPLQKSYSHQNGHYYQSYLENKLKSQNIEEKYSQTDFTPRLEQELVLGQYLEAKLGSDFTELKVRRPKLSKSEQNLSKVENPCSYSSLKKPKNSVSSEENLRFSKWESEVCYVRPNLRASSSSELKISSQNPEIVMVDYGQEEII